MNFRKDSEQPFDPPDLVRNLWLLICCKFVLISINLHQIVLDLTSPPPPFLTFAERKNATIGFGLKITPTLPLALFRKFIYLDLWSLTIDQASIGYD